MSKKNLPNWLLQELPSFNQALFIPPLFEDSTHELWRLNSKQSNYFLKICNKTNSPFWQIMNDLFSFDLSKKIGEFHQLYPFVDNLTPLQIPTIIASESSRQPFDKKAYILSSMLIGSTVSSINKKMVEQLAQHLVSLHQPCFHYWGCLDLNTHDHELEVSEKPESQQWHKKLEQTLLTFSKHSYSKKAIPDKVLNLAIQSCQLTNRSKFVPMMPDLRWDQFLQKEGQLTALVDLDAFVLAPKELDFIILEYILTTRQLQLFKKHYRKCLPIPDISKVRPAYRLLLFLMQILGETDIEAWMNHPHPSDC
ncbi:MAG: hypothetical protein KAG86_08585 [Gammaproteobacteria bacterium]|nr:hypothetical protein [Gammaproteobacteria bacterium]